MWGANEQGRVVLHATNITKVLEALGPPSTTDTYNWHLAGRKIVCEQPAMQVLMAPDEPHNEAFPSNFDAAPLQKFVYTAI